MLIWGDTRVIGGFSFWSGVGKWMEGVEYVLGVGSCVEFVESMVVVGSWLDERCIMGCRFWVVAKCELLAWP